MIHFNNTWAWDILNSVKSEILSFKKLNILRLICSIRALEIFISASWFKIKLFNISSFFKALTSFWSLYIIKSVSYLTSFFILIGFNFAIFTVSRKVDSVMSRSSSVIRIWDINLLQLHYESYYDKFTQFKFCYTIMNFLFNNRIIDETEKAFPKILNKLLERDILIVAGLSICEKNCSSWVFIKFAIPISVAVFQQLFFPTVPVPAVSTICI